MTNQPNAKIKDVYIELKDYEFHHTPLDDSQGYKSRFVGRGRIKERIKLLLKNASTGAGTYLITGFRGMGKTSILRQAIDEVNEVPEPKLLKESTFSLSDIKNAALISISILSQLFFIVVSFSIFRQAYYDFLLKLNCTFDVWITKAIEDIKLLFNNIENIPKLSFLSIDNTYIILAFLPIALRVLGFFFFPLLQCMRFAILMRRPNDVPKSRFELFFDMKKHSKQYIVLYIINIMILCLLLFCQKSVFSFILLLFSSTFLSALVSKSTTTLGNAFHLVIFSYFKIVSVFLVSFALIYGVNNLFLEFQPSFNNVFGSYILPWFLILLANTILSFIILTSVFFLSDLLSNSFILFRKRVLRIPYLQYETFEINLSQDSIHEKDVLKRFNDKILEYWKDNQSMIDTLDFDRAIYKPWQGLIKLFASGMVESPSQYKRILDKCENLQSRLAGSVSMSRDFGTNPNTSTTIANNLPINLDLPIGKVTKKRTVNYPIANAKEAEDELIDIMKDICSYREINNAIPEFIFIVDELDKIEPQSSPVLDERELSDPQNGNPSFANSRGYRKRQEAVAKLLANLKGFLNVAQSKFFFIGGRELFDADLADIADRDSFYSSIFNDVIYIESLYKDKPEHGDKKGITTLIEEYLVKLIDGSPIIKSPAPASGNVNQISSSILNLTVKPSSTNRFNQNTSQSEEKEIKLLKNLIDSITNKADEKVLFKLVSTLQNYIIYLTYRSTGTPKKLVAMIESLIVEEDINKLKDGHNLILKHEHSTGRSKFLKINYNKQYEINLTTDILRPYLIHNSRYLTNLGDKLLFSTPFIFDHIIKFYPYGFSWRNLEMIPEVVLVNKEPFLRDHIKSILIYLSNYHIKQAVSGLYDYKFHSLVRKELSILSKSSDLAAAAFNFTLDESLLVKRHYKKRLFELQKYYQNYQPLQGDNQFVHSISFLETIIGDLHFYDKEFDEAINFYTESIQSLRLPNAIDDKYLTRHQYLIWLRNKLKIGLTLEKIEAFDSALSLYRTLMIDSERYLTTIVNQTDLSNKNISYTVFGEPPKPKRKKKADNLDPRSENHRNMHLITLPFVAHLAALEKHRTDGISYANLYQSKEELRKIIEPNYYSLPSSGKSNTVIENYLIEDDYRKGWLWSDYFSNVGSILFYKNCQFTRFFTPNAYSENDELDSQLEVKFDSHQEFNVLWSEFKEGNLSKELELLGAFSLEKKMKFDERFFIKTDFPLFFNKLRIQYYKSNHKKDNRNKYYFPSLTPLCYYWESLHELTKYQSERILKDMNKDEYLTFYSPLVMAAMYLHPRYFDMVSGRRFYYLANVVSKIGDAIFASLDKEIKENIDPCIISNYDKFNKLLKLENADSDNKSYLSELAEYLNTESHTSFFSVQKVLCIYTLAAHLYRKSGQNYYYTFAKKKILTIIKEVVESAKMSCILDENSNYIKIESSLHKLELNASNKLESTFTVEFTTTNKSLKKVKLKTPILPHHLACKYFNYLPSRYSKVYTESGVKWVNNIPITDPKEFVKLEVSPNTTLEVKFELEFSAIATLSLIEKDKNPSGTSTKNKYFLSIKNDSKNDFELNEFIITEELLHSLYYFNFAIKNIETIKDQKSNTLDNKKIKEIIKAGNKKDYEIVLEELNYPNILLETVQEGPWPDSDSDTAKEKKVTCRLTNKGDKIDAFPFESILFHPVKYICPTYENYSILKAEVLKKNWSNGDFMLKSSGESDMTKPWLPFSKSAIFGENGILDIVITFKKENNKLPNPILYNPIERLWKSLVKSTSWYNSISNRAQINKMRGTLVWKEGDSPDAIRKSMLYNATANHNDVLESTLMIESIKRQLGLSCGESLLIKSTDQVRTKYIRLLELKAHIEQLYHKNQVNTWLQDGSNEPNWNDQNLKNDTIDALFSLRESIRIIQMYDPGYIIGYSFLALAHSWAGDWCSIAENIRLNGFNNDTTNSANWWRELVSAVGSNSGHLIESNSHYEMAIQNYFNVLQMHSEGLAYKQNLHDLYILEDDYNDSLTHFNLAFERYLVNTGQIGNSIEKLRRKIKKSELYKLENYTS